ncbi:uncharacterized protein LOC143199857 [Rhynchophorus ferrugineus]|uniref:uncharacterized protein LOC143199857 n=1 Tax=Rhynchophorus ferrugineus TaxID=354439 RepID=UPI003FCD89A6
MRMMLQDALTKPTPAQLVHQPQETTNEITSQPLENEDPDDGFTTTQPIQVSSQAINSLNTSPQATTVPNTSGTASQSPTSLPMPTLSANPNPTTAPRKEKIPPIVLRDTKKYSEILRIAKDNSKEITATLSRKDGTRLFVPTSNDFRKLTKLLEDRKYAFHSFCPPSERAIRVIIRNIPTIVTVDEAEEHLISQGFHPKSLQRWKLKSGEDLPIIQVVVPNEERNIINLTKIGLSIVKVELQRGNGQPVQCYNCQLFGHSSSRCRAPPRCVKCAGHHETRLCTKVRDEPPKCSNCGDPHTANYTGCSCRPAPRNLRPTQSRQASGNTNSAWINQGGRLAQKLASSNRAAPANIPAPAPMQPSALPAGLPTTFTLQQMLSILQFFQSQQLLPNVTA